MSETPARLQPWIDRWALTPDGAPFRSRMGSWLAPVTWRGEAAMLKVADAPEERDGAKLMAWWVGRGAAKVFACDGEALLLERATGDGSLSRMAETGKDDEATGIVCETVAGLHASRAKRPPTSLKPLTTWFAALEPAVASHGGLFVQSAAVARTLLTEDSTPVVLHGDIHHDNVLDFGDRGWLAIDPKGLIGDRGYDYANLFYNPWPQAAAPDRLRRQLAIAATRSGLSPARLLHWIIAYGGLSAAWTIGGGGDPTKALNIVDIAVGEI